MYPAQYSTKLRWKVAAADHMTGTRPSKTLRSQASKSLRVSTTLAPGYARISCAAKTLAASVAASLAPKTRSHCSRPNSWPGLYVGRHSKWASHARSRMAQSRSRCMASLAW